MTRPWGHNSNPAPKHHRWPVATAETIRRSIRAIEAANRSGELPLASKAHNVDLIRELRRLLEVRR